MANIFSDAVELIESARDDWSGFINFLQTTKGPDGVKFDQIEKVPGTWGNLK